MACKHPRLDPDQTKKVAAVWEEHVKALRKADDTSDDDLSAAYDIRKLLTAPPVEDDEPALPAPTPAAARSRRAVASERTGDES